jgi:2-C-methyl-D-erythritol 4-phosphate cytidylyltransferase
MVEWSIAAFRAAASVRSIVIACPPGHVHDLGGHDLGVVEGGATRAESVANGLETVGTELVAVHDAARPLVTPGLIEDVVATLVADPEAVGAIAAAPITDTVKQVRHGGAESNVQVRHGGAESNAPLPGVGTGNGALVVERTLDRRMLWAAQTPQVFRVEALQAALAAWRERAAADPEGFREATDEAMLVEEAGGRVLIHPSPPKNPKVTTPLDLKLVEFLLAELA